MKVYYVHRTIDALVRLRFIQTQLLLKGMTVDAVLDYIDRIDLYLDTFDNAPQRGRDMGHVRAGLRAINAPGTNVDVGFAIDEVNAQVDILDFYWPSGLAY